MNSAVLSGGEAGFLHGFGVGGVGVAHAGDLIGVVARVGFFSALAFILDKLSTYPLLT